MSNPLGRRALIGGAAAGAGALAIVAAWQDELRAFDRTRRPYLLYPRSQ
ncbi:hypothetical protein SAMN04488543_2643 [Friedmanniella luteola]|uniref:Tat (Twin-arginine translocation) pathway signal sequence n=1 Tax=Friedmanniella luteola TaxID=546871 RepID=A0A1H1W3T5_9ACTN|nr:hypothetical protein [Friedmanniella luteola]SDS91958.1 hypothetical protein SAMN04488543_2643 [Friedmanniella luteola]